MQSPQFPKWILIWKLLFSNFSSAYKWTDYIHFGQTVLCLQQSCEARAYAWATKWVVLCLLFLSWTKCVTYHSIQQHNKWHELCVRKLDPGWVPAYLKRSKKSATYVTSVWDQASSDFGGCSPGHCFIFCNRSLKARKQIPRVWQLHMPYAMAKK